MRFEDFFQEHKNWMDLYPDVKVEDYLHTSFPEYYLNNQPNYELLKEDILKNNSRAKEFFKHLFPLKFTVINGKFSNLLACSSLEKIKNGYGKNIFAHGVEEIKGGLHNLLMMCISDSVHAGLHSWGLFADGPPEMSPVPHGPYYLIYTTNYANHDVPGNPTFDSLKYIVVPFEENKKEVAQHLEKMVEHNLITQERASSFIKRLKSYEEFLSQLNKEHKAKKDLVQSPSIISPEKRKSKQIKHERVEPDSPPLNSHKRRRQTLGDNSLFKKDVEGLSPSRGRGLGEKQDSYFGNESPSKAHPESPKKIKSTKRSLMY